MSEELKQFLRSRNIASSRTTSFNPQGNGQVERYNGIIWQTVSLALHSNNLPVAQWEKVLDVALHCIRSLLSTATNCTPHERLFSFHRKSSSGNSLPTWLTSSKSALLKRHVRGSKYEPLVEPVVLLDVNPNYAHVRLSTGRETTVSLRHLAPIGDTGFSLENESEDSNGNPSVRDVPVLEGPLIPDNTTPIDSDPLLQPAPVESQSPGSMNEEASELRRSSRDRRTPSHLTENYELY